MFQRDQWCSCMCETPTGPVITSSSKCRYFLVLLAPKCLLSVSPHPAAAAAAGIVQTSVIVDCWQATAGAINLPGHACA